MLPLGNMNVLDPTQLGAAIRARRKHLRVTQRDLALTCGIGVRFIVDLEKGKATCQIGKTLHVLRALGLRLDITQQSNLNNEAV
jgi:y4mF family transcriptional regulator